jgi:hypothetical protein
VFLEAFRREFGPVLGRAEQAFDDAEARSFAAQHVLPIRRNGYYTVSFDGNDNGLHGEHTGENA